MLINNWGSMTLNVWKRENNTITSREKKDMGKRMSKIEKMK